MIGTLQALRDQIIRPAIVENRLVVIDTSESVFLSVHASAVDADGRPPRYVELYADEGHIDPQEWQIRGCPTGPPPHAARVQSQKIVAELLTELGRIELRRQVGLVEEPP